MKATRVLIAVPVLLLLLGALSCLLIWIALVRPFQATDSSGDTRPQTAEEAMRRAACAPTGHSLGSRAGDKIVDFHVRDNLQRGSERLVFFDARCAMEGGRPGPRFASIASVRLLPDWGIEIGSRRVWESRFWDAHAVPSGAQIVAGDTAPADATGFITTDGYGVMDQDDGFASGRVLVPGRVAAVEAVLGDGRTVRGGVERGVWVLLGQGGGQMRELRAIGTDGQVLQRIALEP